MSLYFITKNEVPSLVDYMYITSITRILQQLHVLHTRYICIIPFTSVVENDLLYNFGKTARTEKTHIARRQGQRKHMPSTPGPESLRCAALKYTQYMN